MDNVTSAPYKTIEAIDPKLAQHLTQVSNHLVEADSEIPRKYKELILLACSAAIGSPNGTHERGCEAMHHGASDKEVIEALALASFVSAMGVLSDGVNSLVDQLTLSEDEGPPTQA